MIDSEIGSDPQICKYMGRIAMQEVSREYARRSLPATQKAVENTIPDLFKAGTAEVEGGINVSLELIEPLFINMVDKRALKEVYGRSIDRWTQLSLFMNAFVSCVVALSGLTSPVALLIKTRMDETA